MASVYSWLLAVAVVLSCLVGFHKVSAQNTTFCKNFAANIMCTAEHPAPPICNTMPVIPLIMCAESKDNHSRILCPELVLFAETVLKSTFDTVDTVCMDQEIGNDFRASPECWRHAAECSIKLNAVPEGKSVTCGRFNNSLTQCQDSATEACASLQTKFLKKALKQNPCFSEFDFPVRSTFPVSSAHFPAVLASSLSIFALLILRILI